MTAEMQDRTATPSDTVPKQLPVDPRWTELPLFDPAPYTSLDALIDAHVEQIADTIATTVARSLGFTPHEPQPATCDQQLAFPGVDTSIGTGISTAA